MVIVSTALVMSMNIAAAQQPLSLILICEFFYRQLRTKTGPDAELPWCEKVTFFYVLSVAVSKTFVDAFT